METTIQLNKDERILPVVGFENLYSVTSHGRVFSHKKNSKNFALHNGIFKSKCINKYGYEYVSLYKDSKHYNSLVHRLVAKAFIENKECFDQINHIDCCKTNNHVSNLEWCDSKHNMNHARENNLLPKATKERRLKSSKNGKLRRKLTMEQAEEIRNKFDKGQSKRSLSKEYSIDRKSIYEIINRLSYV